MGKPTCDTCGSELEYLRADDANESSFTDKRTEIMGPVSLWHCHQCDTTWFARNTVTLEEWVSQFKNIRGKSRELWKAIREEFAVQDMSMTVRQTFYRMEDRKLVPKEEGGYRRVQYALLKMRRAGAIPYGWIADNTRWVRKPRTYSSMESALEHFQRTYRRALWDTQPTHVEIWIEKDALAGVFMPITDEYDVPLYVVRGYSSETYLFDAAQILMEIDKPIYVYHFGDYDPSGRDAARDIAAKLRGFGAQFQFIEVAVTPQQIKDLNLSTRPTKTSDTRSKKWEGGRSVELDAIPPNVLRQLVRECIEQHIDRYELDMARRIESEERERILEMAQLFGTSTNYVVA